MSQPFDKMLYEANCRLKSSMLSVGLEIRGTKLAIRGLLPPKPNSNKSRPYQQRIALGYNATIPGLKKAEAEALKLIADLASDNFNWGDWIAITPTLTAPMEEVLPEFKATYLSKNSITSWTNYWDLAYKWLVPSDPLSLESITSTLSKYPENTRSRQVAYIAFTLLCKHLNLSLDFSSLKSNYSYQDLTPKNIPSDADIIYWFNKIPKPQWKNAFGIFATYGIRNHEIFHVAYALPKLEILEGKTGPRFAYPVPSSWVKTFNISENMLLPTSSRKTHKYQGQTVSSYFHRLGLPFSIYDLRHAWAIRAISQGIPDSIAAKAMGHSLEVHTRVYQRWISEREMDKAFL